MLFVTFFHLMQTMKPNRIAILRHDFMVDDVTHTLNIYISIINDNIIFCALHK